MSAMNKIGQENTSIHSVNVYMFRSAISGITGAGGKKMFTPLEQVFLQMLLTDQGEFNDMVLDFDFFKEFVEMPDEDES